MSHQPYMTVDPLTAPSGPMGPPSASMTRFKPINILKLLREYWLLLLFVIGIGVGAGWGLYVYLNWEHPGYRSQAAMMLSAPVQDVYAPPAEAGELGGRVDQVQMRANTHAGLMTSQSILARVAAMSDVRATAWHQNLPAQANPVEELDDVVRAWVPRQQSIIMVSASTGDRESSRTIINALLGQYETYVREQNRGQWDSMQQILAEDISSQEDQLRRIEEERESYALEHRVSDLALTHETALQNRTRLNEELHHLRQARSASQAHLNMLRQQAGTGFAATVHPEVLAHPDIVHMDRQVRDLRVHKESLLLELGPTHPRVKSIEQQIGSIDSARREKIAELTRERADAQLQAAVAAVDRYNASIRDIEPQLEAAEQRVGELSRRRASFQALVRQEEELRERLLETRAIADAITLRRNRPDHDGIRIAYRATEAEQYFPRAYIVPLVAIGLIAVVGGLVLLRELLDQRIRGTDDVKMLPNADLLGMVPNADDAPGRVRDIENVVRTDPSGMLAESFRNLRTAINARLDRRGFKTIMFTGAQAGCGTSVVVNNLASAWAFQGRKVLVIDANVRRPSEDRLFGVSGKVGLVDVLGNRATLDEAIVAVGDPDLDVLPAGEINGTPPEMFERSEFRALLAEVESRYDIVVIDTAPALITSDAQLIAKSVDAMVMVIRAVADKRGMIGRMLDLFEGQRADVLGLVLNGARTAKSGYFGKNFRQFTLYHQPPRHRKVNGAPGPRKTAASQGGAEH